MQIEKNAVFKPSAVGMASLFIHGLILSEALLGDEGFKRLSRRTSMVLDWTLKYAAEDGSE